MSSPLLIAVFNHLWQSTLLAGAAVGLTLIMRRNSARVRFFTLLAASLKFLVPFAWLAALGAQIPALGDAAHGAGVSLAGQMMESMMLPAEQLASGINWAAPYAGSGSVFSIVLLTLWVFGALAVGARWLSRLSALRGALAQSPEWALPFAIPVRRCSAQFEPTVVGVFRPVLLLPEGLERRLSPAELHAVLTHERCHVIWKDNLTAALHMLVEVLFWFYPLVWWLGARLITERERACDEQVLAEGHAPIHYAEGILKVCEHFLQPRVPCAAGVGGASLRNRIEDIMKNRWIERLSGLKKALIVIVGGGAVFTPVSVGILSASQPALAQTRTPATAPAPVSSWTPNFKDVDIMVIAGEVGRATGQNFIIHPKIAGMFSLVSSKALTAAEYYEAFVAMLKEHGLKAELEHSNPPVIKIVPNTV